MKKVLLILLIGIASNVFAQHPCDSLSGKLKYSSSICATTLDTIVALTRGTKPFMYKWTNGKTTDTIIVDPYDTFNIPRSVTIKDSCGDSLTIPITIKLETPLLVACCSGTVWVGQSDTLYAIGPNIISYQWEPSNQVTCLNPPLCDSVLVSPTITTTYKVIGTDSAGCETEAAMIVTVSPAGVQSISGAKLVNVYPNPSSTEFTLSLQNKAFLQVADITGRILFSEMENAGNAAFGKELNPGIYFLIVDGKAVGKLVKL